MEWPSPHEWVTRAEKGHRNLTGPPSWNGSLLNGMRDLTGQMYRRNRYYDPSTGQFTQEDPIGLAGGLNLYGFANGDPVSYSDPYGLCPNPTASGLGSLQCALEDIVGAINNAPSIVYDAAAEVVQDDFVRGLVGIPATFIGGGSSVVGMGSLRRATVVETQITRLGGRLANQLEKVNLRHLQAAKAEMSGVDTGWDHVTEVREGMRGIHNTISGLSRILADERLTREERRAAQQLLSRASRALDSAERYLGPSW